MRARMLRRELINDDDQCGLFLDTFHDHRHAYVFYANPYGIQQDALYSEANGPDQSFDTVWHTFTRIRPQGYVLGFEIPFKSLRFQPSPTHTFGVMLARVIPRNVRVVRVNREFGKNNSIGFIYTDRELHTAPNSFCTSTECEVGFNRVGGFDAQFKLTKNWQVNAQAVTSETKLNNGTHLAGPAYQLFGEYSSRKIEYNSTYQDISPGFTTETGFIPRADIRQFTNFFGYTLHPEGKILVSHGPRFQENAIWDHNGTRLNYFGNANYQVELPRQTFLAVFGQLEHERLRPVDFSTLASNRDYAHVLGAPAINTTYFKSVGLSGELDMGTATNFVPRNGPPVLANYMKVQNNVLFPARKQLPDAFTQ